MLRACSRAIARTNSAFVLCPGLTATMWPRTRQTKEARSPMISSILCRTNSSRKRNGSLLKTIPPDHDLHSRELPPLIKFLSMSGWTSSSKQMSAPARFPLKTAGVTSVERNWVKRFSGPAWVHGSELIVRQQNEKRAAFDSTCIGYACNQKIFGRFLATTLLF